MKIIFFVLFIFAISCVHSLTLTDEQKAKVKEYHKICSQETSVDTELVKKARKGTFSDDEKLKEYVFCFLKKADLVNSKGRLKIDVFMAKLPADANRIGARIIAEACKNVPGTGPADNSYEIYKCVYNASPKRVSLI